MIFQSEDMRTAILEGRKTVTRRPYEIGKSCSYRVGSRQAIQPGRGKEGIGRHIFIQAVELTHLYTVEHFCDFEREGFASLKEFKDYWIDLHGEYARSQRVYRIQFRLLSIFLPADTPDHTRQPKGIK